MGHMELSVTHELVEDFCQHMQHAALLKVDNIPPDHCALASAWTQWSEAQGAESSFTELETAQSWEYFWDRFEENTSNARKSSNSIHVFKRGIKPHHTDPKNAHGGVFKLYARSAGDAETLWSYLATKLVLEKVPRSAPSFHYFHATFAFGLLLTFSGFTGYWMFVVLL